MFNRLRRFLSSTPANYPQRKLTIVGSGIIGAFEAYYAFRDAVDKGETIRISVYDRHSSASVSTSANIVPSLTIDEIVSVVPRGPDLIESLNRRFNEPRGVRVDDVTKIKTSVTGKRFVESALNYSEDDEGHALRTDALLELGKRSMESWQAFYDDGDAELQQILRDSNFKPCRDKRVLVESKEEQLNDGYRIDLIYKVENAEQRAISMIKTYEGYGYTRCQILSPAQVKRMDPALTAFCDAHSTTDADGLPVWKTDAVALFRPGGCINSKVFLPKFYDYLERKMGQYRNADGALRNRFSMYMSKNVDALIYRKSEPNVIKGLHFTDRSSKKNKHRYAENNYVFCPGEAVGTLRQLGLIEPDYAIFAGPVLLLNIPLTAEQRAMLPPLDDCKEVHQEGVVLAWQAKTTDHGVSIGVGGTKAFYADQQPQLTEEFANDRHLLQLNIINTILADWISIGLGRRTHGQQLVLADLLVLESKGFLNRWVGSRSLTYDTAPTFGSTYKALNKALVPNARATTHLGSGGVSFAPAAVKVSRAAMEAPATRDALTQQMLLFSHSARSSEGHKKSQRLLAEEKTPSPVQMRVGF